MAKTRTTDHSEMALLEGLNQLPPPYSPPAPTAPQYMPGPGIQGPQPTQPVICQPNNNNITIMMAPNGANVARPVIQYSDHLGWSICNMLCCCFLLGIVAIFYSCKTQDAKKAGDANAAGSHSQTARTLNIISLVLGIVMYIAVAVPLIIVR